MGRKDGGRSDGGSSDFRHRIEGFGNAPMPPPISDSFEDRLHNALSSDDTVGAWYNSALAAVDSMVTSFDENVNAIFDSIEDTVEAIVGDDDPPYEPEQRRSNENQPRRRNSNQDDGERSGIDWPDKVAAICENGDLETFVLMVRSQCANSGEEKEVGGLLSERLLQAEKSGILRVLYVMQAVEEGELPVVMGVIREKCADKLEQLKSQTLCRSLVTQILGPGRPATSSGENASQETKAQEESQPKAKAKPPPKPTDLLDFAEPAPVKEAQPPAQKSAAQPKAKATAKASSTAPADLLDSSPIAATTGGQVDLLDMAPIGPLLTPQSGDLMSVQISQPSTASASSGLTPSSDPFGTFQSFQSSLPTTTPPTTQSNAWANFGNPAPTTQNLFPNMPVAGMRPQGMASTQTATSSAGYIGGVQFPKAMDNFDPNAKPIPNAISNGPPMKMPGVTSGHSMGVGDWSALASSGFSAGRKPENSVGMPSTSDLTFVSGRSHTSQAPAKKDIQLDDVLSSELKKMQSVS